MVGPPGGQEGKAVLGGGRTDSSGARCGVSTARKLGALRRRGARLLPDTALVPERTRDQIPAWARLCAGGAPAGRPARAEAMEPPSQANTSV